MRTLWRTEIHNRIDLILISFFFVLISIRRLTLPANQHSSITFLNARVKKECLESYG